MNLSSLSKTSYDFICTEDSIFQKGTSTLDVDIYKMNIIVTGGAGFIGSNFVFHMLKKLRKILQNQFSTRMIKSSETDYLTKQRLKKHLITITLFLTIQSHFMRQLAIQQTFSIALLKAKTQRKKYSQLVLSLVQLVTVLQIVFYH